jgi:chemotaxis protein methyltransferase CheR
VTAEPPLQELAAAVGLPLGVYRPDHVRRQLERSLAREGAGSWSELLARVRGNAPARSRLRRAVAVSVTGPFRDPEQFELLERELVPELAQRFGRLRVWSAGCSDGSELVSLATVLARLGLLERSFLIGSDLLPENITAARSRVAALPAPLRTHARFEVRDLVASEKPPGRFALVVCRNLGIYLHLEAKARLHRLLVAGLSSGGILLLGRSERLTRPHELGLERAGPHAYRRLA